MKTRLTLIILAALLGTSIAEAPKNREEIARKLGSTLGHTVALPAWYISPDAKLFVSGDMYFYNVEKKLADGAEPPFFGIALAIDTGTKLSEIARDEYLRERMIEKLTAAKRPGIEDEQDSELEVIREKFASTAEEKTKFEAWVKEIMESLANETETQWLREPGFYCVGWLDDQSAVFHRKNDSRACAMTVVVNVVTKVATLYMHPQNDDRRQFKIVLWNGRIFPGATLVSGKTPLPVEVQKLLEASFALNKTGK